LKNYYEILEISPQAGPDEIKTAYRKLVKRFHPDKHGDSHWSNEQFRLIQEAYLVLSNPDKRYFYDRKLNDPFFEEEIILETTITPDYRYVSVPRQKIHPIAYYAIIATVSLFLSAVGLMIYISLSPDDAHPEIKRYKEWFFDDPDAKKMKELQRITDSLNNLYKEEEYPDPAKISRE